MFHAHRELAIKVNVTKTMVNRGLLSFGHAESPVNQ